MYHSYKAHITGKAQPSCSLIPTSRPCQRELCMESTSSPHGTDHLLCSLRCFWIFRAAFVRLTVVVSRCRWMLPLADRISSHVFRMCTWIQSMWVLSTQVVLVSGRYQCVSNSQVSGQAKNEGALIQKCDHWGTHAVEWWLHVPFLSPFPWIVKVLHLQPQKVYAAIIS